MEGIFIRKKFNLWLFCLFACGIFFIGLYVFFNIVDTQASGGTLTFLVFGVLLVAAVIIAWLMNHGAFIHVDEASVRAKYNWFGKIDCRLSDITYAVAGFNTLTIEMKNGKTHTVMGLENSFAIAAFLMRRIPFEITEQPETLTERISSFKAEKRKWIKFACAGLILMLVTVFVTVFLTGEREMYEFSRADWIIFAVMGVTEIAIICASFYCAHKAGKNNIPIEKLQYAVRRRITETQPLLPGNAIGAFANEYYTFRLTLFGYPNQDSVYYAIQEFAADYTFFKSYESEIFENTEQLMLESDELLDDLIDITEKIIIKVE